MMNVNDSGKSLKILCIHGYRQNGEIFRQKTGALRKLLKVQVEFIFVTAPNVIRNADELKGLHEAEAVDQRGWWFSNKNNTFESKKFSEVCVGFENSVSVIDSAFKEQGPFDGILGFSQGATFVSLLCSMQTKGDFQHKIKFAIMVAGFKSRCSPHATYYESKINVPSLHLFGETDQVIPREMSEELLQLFEDPVLATYPGGHYVPANKAQKETFLNFFNAVC